MTISILSNQASHAIHVFYVMPFFAQRVFLTMARFTVQTLSCTMKCKLFHSTANAATIITLFCATTLEFLFDLTMHALGYSRCIYE